MKRDTSSVVSSAKSDGRIRRAQLAQHDLPAAQHRQPLLPVGADDRLGRGHDHGGLQFVAVGHLFHDYLPPLKIGHTVFVTFAVPQTMLSPSLRGAPHDVVAIAARCPTRCCRRRCAVPHTMLSPSLRGAPHDVVAIAACPTRCCRSRRRRSRCPTRCCRRRCAVPHTMLSPSLRGAPHDVVAVARRAPHDVVAVAHRAPHDVVAVDRSVFAQPHSTPRRHALAFGLSTPPLSMWLPHRMCLAQVDGIVNVRRAAAAPRARPARRRATRS